MSLDALIAEADIKAMMYDYDAAIELVKSAFVIPDSASNVIPLLKPVLLNLVVKRPWLTQLVQCAATDSDRTSLRNILQSII